jgi:hypothetical protein
MGRQVKQHTRLPHRVIAVVAGALAAAGCAHMKTSSSVVVFSDERSPHCARSTIGTMSPYRMPLAGPVTDPEDLAYLADFPAEARRSARAGGLEPMLVEILRDREKSGGAPSPRAVSMELELSMRLASFATQLEAVSFEVHCTATQLGEVLGELQHDDERQQFNLAMGSLIAGAIAASAAGAVALARPDDTRTPAVVSIAGGIVTAGLGAMALLRKDSRVMLSHDPNLLAPVFNGADPDHLFPTFVFRMLTLPDDGARGSPRARLLASWSTDLGDVGLPRDEAERLLSSSGGTYTTELVEARVHHLERLASTLQSIARDLELLHRFVVRKLFEPPSSVPAPASP